MNSMRQRVGGTILNLCHARGFTTEQSCNLLFSLIRVIGNESTAIQQKSQVYSQGRLNKAYDEMASNLGFDENHPLYHKARTRICRMEKELARIRGGEITALNRKTWRKDKSDQVAVIDTFSHVIGRPNPKTPEERIKDALMLLYRTNEITPPSSLQGRIMSYQGKPGVRLALERGNLILAKGDAHPVTLKTQNCGEIICQIRTELPEAVKERIHQMKVEQTPIYQLIEWDGFQNWEPTVIKDHWRKNDFWTKDEEKEFINLSCYEGYAELNLDTKEVTVVSPKEQANRQGTYRERFLMRGW